MATSISIDSVTSNHNSNAGRFNTGICNAGRFNSGSFNVGDGNSGNNNAGDWNTGNCNSGDYNAGSFNSGDYNAGVFNIGNYNTGLFNIGDCNAGAFNIPFPEGIEAKDITLPRFLTEVRLTEWIEWDRMSDISRKEHPEDEKHGGHLLVRDLKDAVWEAWVTARQEGGFEDLVCTLVNLPNFSSDIFEQITGISREEIEKA